MVIKMNLFFLVVLIPFIFNKTFSKKLPMIVDMAMTGKSGWVPFSHNCLDIYLSDDTTLGGNCNSNQGIKSSTLQLDECLGFLSRKLNWTSNGRFKRFCSGCSLDGSILTCTCNQRQTSIDLNEHVTNMNGQIIC
jgi:hypothetical protein